MDLQPDEPTREHASITDPPLYLAAAAYLRAAGACQACARDWPDAILDSGQPDPDAHPAATLERVQRRSEQVARGCVTNRHPGARA